MLVRIIKEFGLLLRVKQRTGRAVTECVTLLRWICQVSWLSPRFPLVLQTRGPSLLYSSLFLSLRVSLLSREFYMQSATLLAYVIQTTPTHSCKKKNNNKKTPGNFSLSGARCSFTRGVFHTNASQHISFSSSSLFSLNLCFCVLLSFSEKKQWDQLAPDSTRATGSRAGQANVRVWPRNGAEKIQTCWLGRRFGGWGERRQDVFSVWD